MNKNSFVNKVTAERAILKVVNSYTRRGKQLTGLSSIAIEAWQRFNFVPADSPIVVGLKELSDLCQCLSDRSHETFNPMDESAVKLVSARLDELSQKFAHSFQD
ncbi:hypothetical protein [Janthinobacterium lividum]|uniref:hypothetical protein n=1 Tax=Janthinobacterium lividum TaxID=29581 RepID=UPI001269AF3D|nr:hypothetical protein [Janthinobacterium lividum]